MMNINGHDVVGRMPTFKPDLRDLVRQGIKTETRRVMKPQPSIGNQQFPIQFCIGKKCFPSFGEAQRYCCPYGKPGDIRVMPEPLTAKTGCISYDPNIRTTAYYDDGFSVMDCDRRFVVWRWKHNMLSAMFMPTKYGRTVVQYADIRAERLRDITDVGAIAEGVELHGITRYEGEARDAFAELWNKINAKRGYSWESNPWVWVIKWRLL